MAPPEELREMIWQVITITITVIVTIIVTITLNIAIIINITIIVIVIVIVIVIINPVHEHNHCQNIATGETSQAITSHHFFDYYNVGFGFCRKITFLTKKK